MRRGKEHVAQLVGLVSERELGHDRIRWKRCHRPVDRWQRRRWLQVRRWRLERRPFEGRFRHAVAGRKHRGPRHERDQRAGSRHYQGTVPTPLDGTQADACEKRDQPGEDGQRVNECPDVRPAVFAPGSRAADDRHDDRKCHEGQPRARFATGVLADDAGRRRSTPINAAALITSSPKAKPADTAPIPPLPEAGTRPCRCSSASGRMKGALRRAVAGTAIARPIQRSSCRRRRCTARSSTREGDQNGEARPHVARGRRIEEPRAQDGRALTSATCRARRSGASRGARTAATGSTGCRE